MESGCESGQIASRQGAAVPSQGSQLEVGCPVRTRLHFPSRRVLAVSRCLRRLQGPGLGEREQRPISSPRRTLRLHNAEQPAQSSGRRPIRCIIHPLTPCSFAHGPGWFSSKQLQNRITDWQLAIPLISLAKLQQKVVTTLHIGSSRKSPLILSTHPPTTLPTIPQPTQQWFLLALLCGACPASSRDRQHSHHHKSP